VCVLHEHCYVILVFELLFGVGFSIILDYERADCCVPYKYHFD